MRRVLCIELSHASAYEREHCSHVAPALDDELSGDLEPTGAHGNRSHAGERVSAERLELVVGAGGKAFEAVVDDRDT